MGLMAVFRMGRRFEPKSSKLSWVWFQNCHFGWVIEISVKYPETCTAPWNFLQCWLLNSQTRMPLEAGIDHHFGLVRLQFLVEADNLCVVREGQNTGCDVSTTGMFGI